MYKEILIAVEDERTTVAFLEDGKLTEIFYEQEKNKRIVGNIYKGIVKNVLPGMQAAFVDIGLEKNAFLYIDDVIMTGREVHETNIRDVVKEGQELLVQVTKEPVGTKGPRITTKITLPGRYMVLMPNVDHVGISRRIEDEEERKRLKEIALEIKKQNMGIIIRTVAEGKGQEELKGDMKHLISLWKKIEDNFHRTKPAHIIHRDLELVQRIARDVLTEEVDRVLINSIDMKERFMDYVDIVQPKFKSKIFYEDGDLMTKYNINTQIERALGRKIWLKNGAYIIIDQTEALTAIDVNTGKFVGKNDLKETVFKTNLQAIEEIVRQIRLRNIGGIIIIDFIDMQESEHRQKILDSLEQELKKDRTRSAVMGITQLGLVEMTRKKTRQSLDEILMKECPHCNMKGKVLKEENIVFNIKKKIRDCAARTLQPNIKVKVNPFIAQYLSTKNDLKKLERAINKNIIIEEDGEFIYSQIVVEPVT